MLLHCKRIIKFAWQNIVRNKGLSWQVVFVISIAVFLVSALFFTKAASSLMLAELRQKVDIAVYFKKETAESQIFKIKKDLAQFSEEIASVDYISKESALDKFKQAHQGDALWLQALEVIEGNPLPASLNIKVRDFSGYPSIIQFLEGDDLANSIASISYYGQDNERAVGRLSLLEKNFQNISLVLVIFLALLVVLIIFNTVKLSIYTLKEEILTMRLVGASNWFIRGPFLASSLIYALLAVLVVDVLFILLLLFFNNQLTNWFLGLDFFLYFKQNLLWIVSAQVLVAGLLSIISSFLAVRKHLKV